MGGRNWDWVAAFIDQGATCVNNNLGGIDFAVYRKLPGWLMYSKMYREWCSGHILTDTQRGAIH